MKRILMTGSGIAVALLSLWLGAYALEVAFPYPHWAGFPTLVTAIFGFMAGCALAVIGTGP